MIFRILLSSISSRGSLKGSSKPNILNYFSLREWGGFTTRMRRALEGIDTIDERELIDGNIAILEQFIRVFYLQR